MIKHIDRLHHLRYICRVATCRAQVKSFGTYMIIIDIVLIREYIKYTYIQIESNWVRIVE